MNAEQTANLFRRFRADTADDISAAILTLAASLGRAETPELLTVAEAAGRRGVSPAVIYRMMKAGQLKYTKTGRSFRIAPADLDAA